MTRPRQSVAVQHVQQTLLDTTQAKAPPCPTETANPRVAKSRPPPRQAPAQVADWLTRLTRIHAHARYIVQLFAHPEIAGGQSLQGETYAARATRYDRTLIHDAAMLIRDDADGIVVEVQAAMDSAPPTLAAPGSREKVSLMERRAADGFSIFIDGDAK